MKELNQKDNGDEPACKTVDWGSMDTALYVWGMAFTYGSLFKAHEDGKRRAALNPPKDSPDA